MSHVISVREDAIEPPHGAAHIGADAPPTPGTWEDQVLIFAGCYEIEEQARRDGREETRTYTWRHRDQDITRAHVSELITVASAVETFLEAYLKANPGHSLATVLLHALQGRLRAVEGKAG